MLSSFLAEVPPEVEQSELLDHHPGGRVYLCTSFWFSCSSLPGRTMASSWQICELSSFSVFYDPGYPPSLISWLPGDTDLYHQGPLLATQNLEGVSRSECSMYKVHSSVCTIITLHFAQQTLTQ